MTLCRIESFIGLSLDKNRLKVISQSYYFSHEQFFDVMFKTEHSVIGGCRP